MPSVLSLAYRDACLRTIGLAMAVAISAMPAHADTSERNSARKTVEFLMSLCALPKMTDQPILEQIERFVELGEILPFETDSKIWMQTVATARLIGPKMRHRADPSDGALKANIDQNVSTFVGLFEHDHARFQGGAVSSDYFDAVPPLVFGGADPVMFLANHWAGDGPNARECVITGMLGTEVMRLINHAELQTLELNNDPIVMVAHGRLPGMKGTKIDTTIGITNHTRMEQILQRPVHFDTAVIMRVKIESNR